MAKGRIVNLGAYLFKTYGNDVLQSLPAKTQECISEFTWDKVTRQPITKLDWELDNILEVGDSLDVIVMSPLAAPANRLHHLILSFLN